VGTLIDSSILIAAERRALQLDAALASSPSAHERDRGAGRV
jgi:hypothetical protein